MKYQALPNWPEPKVTDTALVIGIRFEIISCSLHQDHLVCQLRVTNFDEDSPFYLSAFTELYDDQGRTFNPSSVKIADIKKELTSKSHLKDYNAYREKMHSKSTVVGKNLIKNVSVKMQLVFHSIPQDITRITALKIRFSRNVSKSYSLATFNHIAILNQ